MEGQYSPNYRMTSASFVQKTKLSPVMSQNDGNVNKAYARIRGMANRRMV